jgi:hypothetical protein
MGAITPVKKPSSGGGDMRGALLNQIQKGAKLKKVTTVDKSTPLGVGKIAGETSPVKSIKSSPDSSSSSPISSSSSSSRGAPKGFMSLTDELQHKLTLKKTKQSPVNESKEVRPTRRINFYIALAYNELIIFRLSHHLLRHQTS